MASMTKFNNRNIFVVVMVTVVITSFGAQAYGNTWCVARETASVKELSAALDSVCALEMECDSMLKPTNPCFNDRLATFLSVTSYILNKYYKLHQPSQACDFDGVGALTSTDPSYGNCKFD